MSSSFGERFYIIGVLSHDIKNTRINCCNSVHMIKWKKILVGFHLNYGEVGIAVVGRVTVILDNIELEYYISRIKSQYVSKKEKRVICKKLLQHAKITNDNRSYAYVFYYKVICSLENDTMDKFFSDIRILLEYCEQLEGELWLKLFAYHVLGIISIRIGDLLTSLDYFRKILDCLAENKEVYTEANKDYYKVYMNLCCLYFSIKEYKKALSYLKMAQIHQKMLDDQQEYQEQFLLDMNFIDCYFGLGKLNKALNYLTKASKLIENNQMPKYYLFYLEIRNYLMDCAMGREKEADNRCTRILDFEYEKCVWLDLQRLLESLLQRKKYVFAKIIIEKLQGYALKHHKILLQIKVMDFYMRYLELLGMDEEYLNVSVDYFKLQESIERESLKARRNALNTYISIKNKEKNHVNKEKEREILRRKSEFDELTQLPNRYQMKEFFADVFLKAVQKQLYLSIEIIDIDFFKEFNDNYGHLAGDDCLVLIADVIQNHVNKDELAVRYGGDEFFIVRIGKSKEELYRQASLLNQSVIQLAIPHEYSNISNIVTISQGIAYGIPKQDHTLSDFIKAADKALYKVKKTNRNMIFVEQLKEGY